MGLLTAMNTVQAQSNISLPSYSPPSRELHAQIVRMDSIFFDAYNHCKMEVIEQLFSEDIEFFHDKGGLSTSKKDIVNAIRNNICGKVQRELIPGTIEVYPIANYGAVQMGWHQFHNNQEPDAKPHPSKFVTIWKKENEKWVMARVISIH
jgi:ketosteroid isomerase-like protein